MPIFAVSSKNAFVTLVISGVTGPIFIIFVQNVADILPLNIFQSEWRYCKPFSNADLPNEWVYPNLLWDVCGTLHPHNRHRPMRTDAIGL